MKTKNLILSMMAFTLLGLSNISQAQNVTPILNYLGKKTEYSTEKTTLFSVHNNHQDKMSMVTNVVVQEWKQNELGQDILTNTTDFQINPPVKNIKEGEKAVFRLLPKMERSDVQKTYRVTFTHETNKVHQMEGMKVLIPIVQSIPLFVEPTSPKNVDLSFVQKGKEYILTNNGNSTLKLPDDKIVGDEFVPKYILPKSNIKIKSKEKLDMILEEGKNPKNML